MALAKMKTRLLYTIPIILLSCCSSRDDSSSRSLPEGQDNAVDESQPVKMSVTSVYSNPVKEDNVQNVLPREVRINSLEELQDFRASDEYENGEPKIIILKSKFVDCSDLKDPDLDFDWVLDQPKLDEREWKLRLSELGVIEGGAAK